MEKRIEPMKTLNECKDSVAKKYGYRNWGRFWLSNVFNGNQTYIRNLFHEASELYAKETALRFFYWAMNFKHGFEYNDVFCINEDFNKWHDDNGTFITTDQLFNEWDKLGRP